MILSACGPQTSAQATQQGDRTLNTAPKRIVAAIGTEPESLYQKLNAPHVRGVNAVEEIMNAGLARKDGRGVLLPQIAEAVPTTENGLWTVSPDGRMETRWQIRPTAKWQDGTPFTAHDLVFTGQAVRDRDLPQLANRAYEAIESIEAVDSHTILVRWTRPFIQADQMFTTLLAMPIPAHLLENSYQQDKKSIFDQPYWLKEYIGTGPFRLKEYAIGRYLILEAFEDYVGGRPRLDTIQVQFIPDQNTMSANLLAGTAHVTLGQTLSFEQALQMRDLWRDGKMATVDNNWVALFPQFLNPSPTILGDVTFRRALMMGVDRQELVDSFQGGLAPIAPAP